MAGKVPKGILKRSTLYDHFEREGLTKELGKKESKVYQRFSPTQTSQSALAGRYMSYAPHH